MHLTTSRVVVDERGWRELAKLLGDTWKGIEKIQRESGKRLRDSGPDGQINAVAVAMLFERGNGGDGDTDGANPGRATASQGARR
jgi:hypothetical protein